MSETGADRADRLLRAYVLGEYRDDWPHGHIGQCPEAKVLEFDSRNGSYGCETGCEYLRLEASVGCPHEDPVDYEYGEFGDIAGLITDLEQEEARERIEQMMTDRAVERYGPALEELREHGV
jgi:hypothetical protein